ncbi:aspartyl protease family protein [Clostridium weizhouense]|uniref:Aspartyl protease family protein n=1 Tax=Clostridium weizhouense TaxID=2859781 RepID=A0ABS7AQT7_9CLOT|nr:aspartyl protease family protein [Clostridium weizhouense]MBW6411024.1 aspartyl protease family protein [Clostridium weizhouense]
MVDLKFRYGLPFCKVEIIHNNKKLILDNVLIDTGSGGTLFKMDKVEEIDITIDVNDSIETIHGIGASEFVYKKTIDEIRLNDLCSRDVKVEIGIMDYGFNIDGIIGIDFLRQIDAIIDLEKMKMYSRSDNEK